MALKSYKWIATSTFLFVIAGVLVLFYVQRSQEGKANVIDISGSMSFVSSPDEGATVLAECARTACVATKAAELTAQAEAERRAWEEEVAAEAASNAAQSCNELLSEWASAYGGLPSYQRPPMPCGPYAGYSSSWTAGQAQWEAMTPQQKEAEARRNGGTYRAP